MTFADRLDQHIADTYPPDPIVHRCNECDWVAEGQLTETLPLFRRHKLEKHGVRLPKRTRPNGTGAIHHVFFERSLEENVAASRLKGGTARSRRDEWETAA